MSDGHFGCNRHVVKKILSYLKRQDSGQSSSSNKSQISLLPDERAPPRVGLLSESCQD